MPPLVALLNHSNGEAAKEAARALGGLAEMSSARSQQIVDAGALPLLMAQLEHSDWPTGTRQMQQLWRYHI